MLQYKRDGSAVIRIQEKHGHYPLWSESSFSGMPAYTIAMDHSAIYLGPIVKYFPGSSPAYQFFFLACVCFYILMLVLRVNPGSACWLRWPMPIAPMILSSLSRACHQNAAIAYAPGVFAGLFLLFQRKFIWGTVLMMVFLPCNKHQSLADRLLYLVCARVLTLFYIVHALFRGRVRMRPWPSSWPVFAGCRFWNKYPGQSPRSGIFEGNDAWRKN